MVFELPLYQGRDPVLPVLGACANSSSNYSSSGSSSNNSFEALLVGLAYFRFVLDPATQGGDGIAPRHGGRRMW